MARYVRLERQADTDKYIYSDGPDGQNWIEMMSAYGGYITDASTSLYIYKGKGFVTLFVNSYNAAMPPPVEGVEKHTDGTIKSFIIEVQTNAQSGGRSTMTSPKWTTTGRKVTLKDGSKRALYKNAGKPGELRIRRMSTRAGQTVATYVKPPK